MSLRDVLKSLQPGQAILHYNIATFEQFKAGVGAVRETGIPLIFGVSEGEENYLGIDTVRAVISQAVASSQAAADTGAGKELPLFLNADHHKTVEAAKGALDHQFDAILFDGSELSFDQNISRTKEVTDYRDKQGSDAVIEGELGYLAGKSDLEAEVEVKEEYFTKPEEAERFVRETGVELLAVSVGNVHGIPDRIVRAGKTQTKEEIDVNRLRTISQRLESSSAKSFLGLVLHGGSGITDEDFRSAIEAGAHIVHLNTVFRNVWKDQLQKSLKQKTITPYKMLQEVVQAVQERVVYYQRLFWSAPTL